MESVKVLKVGTIIKVVPLYSESTLPTLCFELLRVRTLQTHSSSSVVSLVGYAKRGLGQVLELACLCFGSCRYPSSNLFMTAVPSHSSL